MVEEKGIAVAIEQDAIWVETRRQSTCSSCSSRSMCGQELLNKLGGTGTCHQVRALNRYPVRVGDTVTIAIPEQVIVKGAFLVYLLPLLLMMAGLVLAEWLSLAEGWVILGAFSGLLAGFAVVGLRSRWLHRNQEVQPHVINVGMTSVEH
ncbi:SoxR reducing system RseC family protein [Aestuariirhabdus sp. Z084]|uniref:SoxR reducing system RseC family protein n=1 Tax=Aestuariirhabdus haliotis TaxID=2918751 RepID=UPI00201B38E6|nr:SoxR reducing system RseC family protein [Aestuariirhabdus haliotis]MCL6417155.1 SoxR reducing system RseC family protein [Aestuariirhabdus haliotis]MCL6421113.1 SoxR reducing system RseC family protein [Aestuariirhabdus haliotis]